MRTVWPSPGVGQAAVMRPSPEGSSLLDPRSISGLVRWYDFSDPAQLFKDSAATDPVTADGDALGCVRDKSTAGINAIQATSGNKPVYKAGIRVGRSVGRFDGTDDFMNSASSAAWATATGCTLFVVASMVAYSTGTDTHAGFLSNASPATTVLAIRRTAANTFNAGSTDGASIVTSGNATANDTAWHYFAAWADVMGLTVGLNIDGTSTTNGFAVPSPATGASPFGVGSRSSSAADVCPGDIGEVLVYNRFVSISEQALIINNYLKPKWGL